jgi:hypothetical protein
VVLVLIALTAVVLHVEQLGFYSDDWTIPGGGSISEDQSLLGIMRATGTPDTPMRPVALFVLAFVYRVFGANPTAFHVVNTAYLSAMGVCFYLVLRELRLLRVLSFSISTLFVVMPHYSATRFWVVAHPINLSMALYFLSVFAELKAIEERDPARIASWVVFWVAALTSGLLAYEQLLPLAVATPLLTWWHGRHLADGVGFRPIHRRFPVILAATVVALVPVIAFKMSHTSRLSPLPPYDQIRWTVWYFSGALRDAYVEFGVKLPLVVWRSLRDHWDPAAVLFAGIAGVLAYFQIRRTTDHSSEELGSTRLAAALILVGGAVFVAGFGLVMITTMPVTSATGINNRLAIVATTGVASSFVAVVAWICGRLSHDMRVRAFSGAMALLIGANVLVVSTLGSFWAEAAREQYRLLDNIRTRFPDGPPGRVFLLDGTCPYIGPGIVFNSSWDLRLALTWIYRREGGDVDVVTADTNVEGNGVRTSMFRGFIQHVYPYGDLYVYRPQQRVLSRLSDYEAARQYFSGPGRDYEERCPPGQAGHGAGVLGIPVGRFWAG